MAHLNKADIVETWVSKADPKRHYYVTKNRQVLRVQGQAFASASIMYIRPAIVDKPALVGFHGTGRFAHYDNDPRVLEFLTKFAARLT